MFGLIRMPRFLRRLIRRKTSHMPHERALEVKEKISLLYAFVAWNMLGGVLYMIYTGRWTKTEKEESGLSQGRQFVKMLKMENVTLHQMKGFQHVKQFNLDKEMPSETETVNKDEELCEEQY